MQFWDSCGQERYNSVTRIFYRGSQCVLFVYEISNASTLRDLEKVWISDIQESLRDAYLVLVGNKVDIDSNNNRNRSAKRQVTYEEGLEFMKKYSLNYFTEVSAKTGDGIGSLIENIAKNLYHEHREKLFEYRESETGSSTSSHNEYNKNDKRGTWVTSDTYVTSINRTLSTKGRTLYLSANQSNSQSQSQLSKAKRTSSGSTTSQKNNSCC